MNARGVMVAMWLGATNEGAAREYLARSMALNLGLEVSGIDHDATRDVVIVSVRLPDGRVARVEDPCPTEFPSKTFEQRLSILA